jgi:Amino acid transporters
VLIALCDELVVAELGAALPAAGGTYVFLREGFGPRTWGRMLAFLFVWQLLFAGPLEIASGNIGLVQYLKVFWPGMTDFQMKLTAAGVGVFLIFTLYRKITDIAKIMLGLWITMIATTGWVIVTGIIKFDPALAFDIPPDAWTIDARFWQGLGQGTANVLYLFLGYYQVCYLGAEVRDPGRTIPRAVVYSILGVTLIDVLISFGFIGVVPWREGMASQSIGSEFVARVYGPWAGQLLAGMIVVTAFASIFALLLGYSRVPYAAAQDGVFLRWFEHLHPTKEFPHRSLLLVGIGAIIASFFTLQDVILALMAARIIIQFNAQVIALLLIRARRPDIEEAVQSVAVSAAAAGVAGRLSVCVLLARSAIHRLRTADAGGRRGRVPDRGQASGRVAVRPGVKAAAHRQRAETSRERLSLRVVEPESG